MIIGTNHDHQKTNARHILSSPYAALLVSLIDSYSMAYSREKLVEIRQSVIASNVRLDCSLWTTIKQAGICAKRPGTPDLNVIDALML